MTAYRCGLALGCMGGTPGLPCAVGQAARGPSHHWYGRLTTQQRVLCSDTALVPARRIAMYICMAAASCRFGVCVRDATRPGLHPTSAAGEVLLTQWRKLVGKSMERDCSTGCYCIVLLVLLVPPTSWQQCALLARLQPSRLPQGCSASLPLRHAAWPNCPCMHVPSCAVGFVQRVHFHGRRQIHVHWEDLHQPRSELPFHGW